MNKPTEPVKSSRRGVILAGLAGAAAAVAALYVIAGPNGNITNAQSCTAALSAAAAAKPYAKGEVAAFLPASEPLGLKTLTFKGPDGQEAVTKTTQPSISDPISFFRREMNRLIDNYSGSGFPNFGDFFAGDADSSGFPDIDIHENDSELFIEAELSTGQKLYSLKCLL